MAETLSLINLTPDEIEKLPARLRDKISAAFSPTNPIGVWLVGDKAERIARMIELFPQVAARRSEQLSDANIEKMLDVFLSDAPRAPVETELDIDNTRLRADYLQETPCLTAAQVHAASGLNPRNRSEPASRWKREGRLFAVRRSGIDLYPAFQFEDGVPRPVIKKILAALPKEMTGWQIAMWFASGNGWLGGDEPQGRLADPDAVVDAALKLADPAIG